MKREQLGSLEPLVTQAKQEQQVTLDLLGQLVSQEQLVTPVKQELLATLD